MNRPVKLSKSALRALATRRKIVGAAGACFLNLGYGSATIKDIAASAGVASQTVYFVFHNKVSILKAVLDFTIAGDAEPIPIKERPWIEELRSAPGPKEAARVLAVHGGNITARTAPLFRVLQSASADPDVDALLKENKRQRGETLDLFARMLVDRGLIAGEAHFQRFADVLYTVLSEECYLLLVEERGWTRSNWQAWIELTLSQELTTGGTPKVDPCGEDADHQVD